MVFIGYHLLRSRESPGLVDVSAAGGSDCTNQHQSVHLDMEMPAEWVDQAEQG